jgi:predicted small secreted protein
LRFFARAFCSFITDELHLREFHTPNQVSYKTLRRKFQMKKFVSIFALISVSLFLAACGGSSDSGTGKVIKSGPAGNNLTVTLSSPDGILRKGRQQVRLSFTDSSGKPVDVGQVSLNFFMPAMGSMAAMNNPATLTTTSTPGNYNGDVDLEMGGEWQAQIAYSGPAGNGKATLTVSAQ